MAPSASVESSIGVGRSLLLAPRDPASADARAAMVMYVVENGWCSPSTEGVV
jgi:hypothetical protein